jgi:hypothetical protein
MKIPVQYCSGTFLGLVALVLASMLYGSSTTAEVTNSSSGPGPDGNPDGYTVVDNLRIGAIINTEEKGPVEALWRQGGQDTTERGDQVAWGHFYASPNDVNWGSESNPDLFVKIWFDQSGRLDVNYFHVSVPDIEVYSDFPADGTYDLAATTTLNNRYVRQEYTSQTGIDSNEVDDDGDGYTENQGDCDDNDAGINPAAKIDFDLESLNDEGLYGPPDGLRSLDYEFCIPASEVLVDEVTAIDSSVTVYRSSAGRIGCGEDEYLCIGNTHQQDFRHVLCQLTALPYVEEIQQTFWE